MSLCDLIGHTQYHVFATEHHQLNQWLFSQSYVTLMCRNVALYKVYTLYVKRWVVSLCVWLIASSEANDRLSVNLNIEVKELRSHMALFSPCPLLPLV